MKTLILTLFAVLALDAQAQVTPAASLNPPVEIKLTTINVNDEGEHLLADTRGNTLYVFDLDLNQKTSACNAACAEVWPPYLLSATELTQLKAPYGSVVRENNKSQLTYEGHPVYSYAFDRGAAADSGDNVGNVWHYIEIK
jgi:predicted lipoprotein with Yx(FWY)xxD motif